MEDDTQSNPFGARMVALLIGAGVVLAFGFLLLSGFGQDLERSFAKAPPAESNLATGFRALRRLGELVPGGHVAIERGPHQVPPAMVQGPEEGEPRLFLDPGGLMIVTPAADTRPADLEQIVQARRHRPTLIVLPKWRTAPAPLQRDRERRYAPLPDDEVTAILPKSMRLSVRDAAEPSETLHPEGGIDGMGVPAFPPVDRLHTLQGDGLEPLLLTKGGEIVLARWGSTGIFILADPDLLNNQGLARPEAAFRAMRLLGALNPDQPGRLSFDLSLHFRAGDRNLVKLMFQPPFLAVTIALFAAALLAGLASAVRFGPVRREGRAIALGKAALADNIAALTRLAGKTARAGGAYADMVRDWVARRVHAPRALSGEALAPYLDRLGGQTRYSELDARLRAARTEADMLRAAQQLDDWRKEVTK